MSETNPKIVVCDGFDLASQQVAKIFANAIKMNPEIVLGLATGSTPVGTYQALRQMHCEGNLDFSKITTFNLDEYIGLGPKHPQSFRAFMQEQLFDHVNIEPQRTHVPSGLADDPAIEGKS